MIYSSLLPLNAICQKRFLSRFFSFFEAPPDEMNALTYAVGVTEGARSDVVRYVRLLRRLDERMESHLVCLRLIVEDRQKQLLGRNQSVRERKENQKEIAEMGKSRGGKALKKLDVLLPSVSARRQRDTEDEEPNDSKRLRRELAAALKECRDNLDPAWRCSDEMEDAQRIPEGEDGEEYSEEELLRMFRAHAKFVQRYVLERDAISEELVATTRYIKSVASLQLSEAELRC